MGARSRRAADPPTEEAPPPVAQPTPTAALGWETRVEIRLDRLEQTVDGMREDLDDKMERLYALLERPSLHERCLAGVGEIVGRTLERLTEPAALRWVAIILIALTALLTGASLSGWGVTIGGAVDVTQPALRSHAAPGVER